MIEANWHFDLGQPGRDLWRGELIGYDADLATRAVVKLARRPLPGGRARPNIADVRAALLELGRREVVEREAWHALPPGPLPKPAWVSRWERARAAGDFRIFPEQVPGYLDHQKDDPLDERAYALPTSPQDDATDWVQPHEYAESA